MATLGLRRSRRSIISLFWYVLGAVAFWFIGIEMSGRSIEGDRRRAIRPGEVVGADAERG